RGKSGKEYLVNLGCALTPGRPTDDPHWIQRFFTQAVIRAEILRQTGKTDALAGTIEGLALVMDRSQGSVFLDNVRVVSKTAQKTWTYAGDNGNGVPGAPPPEARPQGALVRGPGAADVPQHHAAGGGVRARERDRERPLPREPDAHHGRGLRERRRARPAPGHRRLAGAARPARACVAVPA